MNWRILLKILFRGKTIPMVFIASLVLFLGCSLVTLFFGTYLRFDQVAQGLRSESPPLVISKQFGLFNTLLVSPAKFSPEELERISESGLFEKIAPLTPAAFEVQAQIDIKSGIRTSLFLESVPLDILEPGIEDFEWSKADEYVPIIIAEDFIDLYNYGFSLAMGSPQVPASALGQVPIKVIASGAKGTRVFKARIHTTTKRVQSILVPQSFMHWANRTLTHKTEVLPSRLILIPKRPSDEQVAAMIQEENWKLNENKFGLDKYGAMIKWIMLSISSFCFVFALLVFFLLLSNLRISILSKIEEWKRLIEMGYPISVFSRLVLGILSVSSLLAFLGCLVIVSSMHGFLADKLWVLRIYWPDSIIGIDLYVGLGFIFFVLGSSWLILKKDERKVLASG